MRMRVEENVDNTWNEMSIYHLAYSFIRIGIGEKARKLHTLAYKLNKYTVLYWSKCEDGWCW